MSPLSNLDLDRLRELAAATLLGADAPLTIRQLAAVLEVAARSVRVRALLHRRFP